jgi:hypothetical protein
MKKMKAFKLFFLVLSIVLLASTSLQAWTSSNEGVCYTMDTLVQLSLDITYNATNQMYEVDCDIIILENDTLNILPGEIVKFFHSTFNYYGIAIHGCLIALGNQNQQIILGDPEFNISTANIWCGIQFYNTSMYGGSILSYCNVIGAINVNGNEWDGNAETGIFCENSSPIIDHCLFNYMNSDYETGGGSAIACKGQSYPIISYCKFKNLIRSIAIWCNPWDASPDTVNYPSPLVFGCNIMHTVYSFFFSIIDYDVAIYHGGFLDNCYLGAYNSNYVDNTLGIPIDTIGDGICNTTSTYWMKRFRDVDGVTHPRSDTLITGINENEIEILPTTTSRQLLKNCYPNPFSDFTSISFEIPVSSIRVSLKIIDSKGNIVRDLIKDKLFKKGNYSMDWMGDDNSGKPASSGIYFYSLIYNGKVDVKKAIVVK